jgi:small subunit ribosomal protein S20
LPNTKSAIKRVKVNEKKRMRNKPVRTRARRAVADVRHSIAGGDLASAQEELRVAISALDKAASKGVIHRNNAARRKSRLMKALNKAQGQAGEAQVQA